MIVKMFLFVSDIHNNFPVTFQTFGVYGKGEKMPESTMHWRKAFCVVADNGSRLTCGARMAMHLTRARKARGDALDNAHV